METFEKDETKQFYRQKCKKCVSLSSKFFIFCAVVLAALLSAESLSFISSFLFLPNSLWFSFPLLRWSMCSNKLFSRMKFSSYFYYQFYILLLSEEYMIFDRKFEKNIIMCFLFKIQLFNVVWIKMLFIRALRTLESKVISLNKKIIECEKIFGPGFLSNINSLSILANFSPTMPYWPHMMPFWYNHWHKHNLFFQPHLMM